MANSSHNKDGRERPKSHQSQLPSRKRINNSLDQLRSLLPYSVNMKKDMASLLEQTVEYINIMHTVLNEDKPACLNKVYLAYRQKTEEIESFRKSFKKSIPKRTKSDAGCSWTQSCHHSYNGQAMDIDPFAKRSFNSPYYDQIPPHSWPQQKNLESFLQNQPSLSGQSQIQYATVPQHTATRSLYYPAANQSLVVKQYDMGSNFTNSQGSTDNLDASQPENNNRNSGTTSEDSERTSLKTSTEDLQGSQSSSGQAALGVTAEQTAVGQTGNCDIATAAMATGVINTNANLKPAIEVATPDVCFDERNSMNPFGSLAPWFSSCSLPPLTLSQHHFMTTETNAGSSATNNAVSTGGCDTKVEEEK